MAVTGVPSNGTSWTAGEQVPVDITVTNTSGGYPGLRPSALPLAVDGSVLASDLRR